MPVDYTQTLPLSKQARIVEDLARGYRSAGALASQHAIPIGGIEQIRAKYGPDSERLHQSLEQLRGLEHQSKRKTAEAQQQADRTDGLTTDERADVRRWAVVEGIKVGTGGRVAAAVIAQWRAAGSPSVVPKEEEAAPQQADAEPADVETVLDPTGTDVELDAEQDGAPCRFCGRVECDSEHGTDVPAAKQADLDAAAVDAAGTPVPPPAALPRQTAPRAASPFEAAFAEWASLFLRAQDVPELAPHLTRVADAVDALADAYNEHQHRQQMVDGIVDALAASGVTGDLQAAALAVLDRIDGRDAA